MRACCADNRPLLHSFQVREKAMKARSKVAQNASKQSHAQRQEVGWDNTTCLRVCACSAHSDMCVTALATLHLIVVSVCIYTQYGLRFASPGHSPCLPPLPSPLLPFPSPSPLLPPLPSLPLQAAQAKKEEKIRQEKERLMEMDPDTARKLEVSRGRINEHTS